MGIKRSRTKLFNLRSNLKPLLISCLLFINFILGNGVKAQNDTVRNNSSDGLELMNFIKLPYYYSAEKDIILFNTPEDVRAFCDSMKVEMPENFNNRNEKTFAVINYHGMDYRSMFTFDLRKADDEKKVFLSVNVFYGGSRAGGNYYSRWVSMPKVPEGYEVSYNVIDRKKGLGVER